VLKLITKQQGASTWNQWSRESEITGDPMSRYDAVMQSLWALDHGKIGEWSYAGIEHFVD
jgi:hypothetical protein